MSVAGTLLDLSPADSELRTTPPRYVLRLYVTGTTARSERAVANAKLLCETYLIDRYNLEIVDIYQHPAAAQEHQVVAAPTLVRVWPTPLRRLIGDLSDHRRVLAGLGLALPGAGAR